jgi:hypothetical protein
MTSKYLNLVPGDPLNNRCTDKKKMVLIFANRILFEIQERGMC